MSAIDRETQRRFFRALRDRPLDYADPEDRKLYQPLHPDGQDPVDRLFDTIDFSDGETTQLVAGFRGTGKTTEFSRLEARLWEEDHLVIRVDLDDYIDMHSPVEIAEFLLITAGAISDCLVSERLLGEEEGRKASFWTRLRDFLGQEVEVASVDLKAGPGALRVNLRGDRSFRERVRRALDGRLPRLVAEVHDHHREVLSLLRARWGDDAQLVVILDSLEHLRGVRNDAEEVHKSIEELFFTHSKHLQLPETHVIMSVPAYLSLTADNVEAEYVTGAVQAWPACHVRHVDGSVDDDAVERMVRLVERRGEWWHFLPGRPALEELILASGGYIRDLLNMLIEAVHQARNGVEPDTARRVASVIRRAYLPIYSDERAVLRKIAEARSLSEVTTEERRYVIRFLDSHLVLCYLDEVFWYEVHPLVREAILEPVERAALSGPPGAEGQPPGEGSSA